MSREFFRLMKRLRDAGAPGERRPSLFQFPALLALLLSVGLLTLGASAFGQATKLQLSAIIPGTENVQLVYNGDFQFQGPVTATNTHPWPLGWSRLADMFADPGTNMVLANSGVVASALVNGGAPVCKYQRTITLEAATDYVLSAYLWNMGDAANHVTTVIDLNDAPQEPQVTLVYSDANANQGYFVYRSFNTTNTGTSVTLRAFYDNPVGAFTAARYYPLGAQWDNLAITKASDFLPPQPSGAGANLRPLVTLTNPVDGANLVFTNLASLQLAATASDPDGAVTNVEFYAGATWLGGVTTPPYSLVWSNFGSGNYQLTAKATDNLGAGTVSAPVSISVTAPPPPPPTPPADALHILAVDTNFALYWPTSITALALQCASNPVQPEWDLVTNGCIVDSNQFVVTVPNAGSARYFRLGQTVNPSTLTGKMLMGYQGWFACPGDGSPMNRWVHWFDSQTPTADNVTVDFWPDISELDPDELFATGMTMSNGSPAKVYAAWTQKTVVRHMKWMRDYNLDGVFLQRFTSELSNSKNFGWRNQVTSNVWAGAEAYGRVFAIMYDISGQNEATLVSTLTNDWLYLVNTMHVTNSPRYIQHQGKPVVAIWGFGFTSRSNTPAEAQATIAFFKAAGCTVMGGVPTYWRTLSNDSQTDPAWAAAYRSFDILSPWSVGRFNSLSGADNFKLTLIIPDLADCTAHGIDYMPVLFPGFSWHNLYPTYPLNQIPRLGGTFYWRQAVNAISAGCTMSYGAMFDEMNEGTSMFKMAPTPAELPAQGTFVPLNIDGQALPSDWYLRLADQASRMLRHDIPLQYQIPITP